MKLDSVMTQDVEVIRPDATLQEAARLMRDRNIGSLPICDDDRLLGMLTDRDIAVRAISENRDCATTQVREIMSTPIIYCFADQEAEEVARIMEAKKIRRVVVLNRDKRMVGIVSLDNLAENQALAGEVLANLTHSIHTRAA